MYFELYNLECISTSKSIYEFLNIQYDIMHFQILKCIVDYVI